MRCSCGKHDLPDDKPLQPCHFCRHPTTSQAVIIWELGLLWYPICHACVTTVPDDEQRVLVHLAPPELVARAHAHSGPSLAVGGSIEARVRGVA